MNITIDKPVLTHNEAETEAFAAAVAAVLQPGSVIALTGDLGAGKTVFTRGFARALGITEAVSSPTYTIVQEYRTPEGRDFFHLDLYRISDEYSALGFGVDEYLDDPEAFALVEWPERIAGIMPEHTVCVNIRHLGGDLREITFSRK
jgi:tRNA threonylcarbamoyladenosine biosynthesis protein TsaE